MIPISKPYIGDLEKKYLNEALSSGWISSKGYFLDKFEEAFANFIGTKYCILTANGTVAIHLALMSMGINKDDEIIVPDLTFVASANAIVHCGAIPVIAEIDKSNWCLDVNKLKSQITNKTKAIMPVHIYGQAVNMTKVIEIAKEYNLKVVEDVAEAHGAIYNGNKLGSFGDASTFSFFANKIITTGEGGSVMTNNETIYNEAKLLRDHAMDQNIKFWHPKVGYNYRMTNLQAAIGCAQIEQIDSFIYEREIILDLYRKNLKDINVSFNPIIEDSYSVNWLTSMLILDMNVSRDNLIKYLFTNGIESRPFFYPLSKLPMYKDINVENPIADEISNQGINLPTYVGLTKTDIKFICDKIKEFFQNV
jgi:perosamine synthetase